jgi:DNA polymerase-3 subunit epsilon
MVLNLKKPLIIFDLETTGTNISADRIVEIAMIKLMPDGEQIEKTRRLNPTIPIPKEVSLIHGIYDADVVDEPTFKQVARSMTQFMEGCDLAGYNIMKFDVPLLVEEFLRADIDFEVDNRNLLDAQKIFHMMEKRNLTAAYKFYCGKDLINAHSAAADTSATMEVLLAQIEKYKGYEMTNLLGQAMGTIENNPDKIHELINEKMVDLAGRMVFDQEGREIFNFGKHKGRLVSEVLKTEPSFYDWMMKGDFPLDTKRKLTKIRLANFNLK